MTETKESFRFKLVILSSVLAVAAGLSWHFFAAPVLSSQFFTVAANECVARADRFSSNRTIRTYSVDYQSDSKSDFSRLFTTDKADKVDASQKPQVGEAAKLNLRATWEISTLEHEGRLTSFGRLLSPEVTLEHNGQTDSAFNQRLKGELARPVLIELSSQGEVIELIGQKDLSKVSRNILRSLIAESQLVLPLQESPSWIARERDANGFFEATYRVSPEQTANARNVINVIKSKARYIELGSKTKMRQRRTKPLEFTTQLEPTLNAAIELDCSKGTLSSLTATGTLKTHVNRTEIGINQYQLTMKLVSVTQLPTDTHLADLTKNTAFSGAKAGTEKYSLTSAESAEAMELLIQKNELGDLTFEKLLSLLKAAKTSGDPAAIDNLYLKFKALIYLYPEACKPLARQMKQEDPKRSKAMLMLATALSTVGSPQAQDALVDVLSSRSSDITSANILIPALGMTDYPTPKSEETLRELIHSSEKEDIISTAGLSLGAMAGNLADQDPERSRAIVESVQKDYLNADTDQQKQYLLSVLGNTGSDQTLPVINSALESSNGQLQAEAAMALRFVQGREAQAKLVDLLKAGAIDDSVKQAAASALSYREPTLGLSQALQTHYAAQNSELVRRELLKAVFENRAVDPSVADWLKGVANRDPSPEVRKLANDYANMNSHEGGGHGGGGHEGENH
jgi:hypothetical protein